MQNRNRYRCRYAYNIPLNWSNNPLTGNDQPLRNIALHVQSTTLWYKTGRDIFPNNYWALLMFWHCSGTLRTSSHTILMYLFKWVLRDSHFKKWVNWRTERLSDILKVTQLVNEIDLFCLSFLGQVCYLQFLTSLHN